MTLDNKQPFGEVVASNLDRCTIQAWKWDSYPPYGSLVQIMHDEITLLGLVESISTAPLDGTRTPTAYRKTEPELKAEMPHIFALLRTTINATMLGARTSRNTPLSLPIRPAQIHSFSTVIDTKDFHIHDAALIIRRITTIHEPQNADTLIQQFLQHQKNTAALSQEQLQNYISAYISAVGNDYKRIFELNRFVQGL